jgi:nucleoside-diphosphate-sugar epimerase
MVIGNGIIAKAFNQLNIPDNILVFASGVSNSSETSQSEFDRELKLLETVLNNHPESKIIYFSTISVLDPDSSKKPYIKHKLEIENIISAQKNYLILRSPNIVGKGGNPNTLINYLINSINRKDKIVLWKNTERSFLGVDDFVLIAAELLDKFDNKMINLFHPVSYSAFDIYKIVANFLKNETVLEMEEKGRKYLPEIDIELMKVLQKLSINLSDDYLNDLLLKYYKNNS